MKSAHFFAIAFLLVVMSSAGAVPSSEYTKAARLNEFVIFSNSELSQIDVVAAAGYRHFCPRHDYRYSNRNGLLLSKGWRPWMTGPAIVKQWKLAANRRFHGLGAPIENLQIDLAPQFLWDYNATIADISR